MLKSKNILVSMIMILTILLTMFTVSLGIYADEFTVSVKFNISYLEPNRLLTAYVSAKSSSTPYSGTKDVLLIVGLYDPNNTMINISYITKAIEYNKAENISAGFKLPSTDLSRYNAKAFMWDGNDIRTTNMIPLSNCVVLSGDPNPVEKALIVTPAKQFNTNACWAASAWMAVNWTKSPLHTQQEIYNRILGSGGGTALPEDQAKGANFADTGEDTLGRILGTKFKATIPYAAYSLGTIDSYISAYKPIQACVGQFSDSGIMVVGHSVVIFGINHPINYVGYVDPWDGNKYWISYDSFCNGGVVLGQRYYANVFY